MALFLVKDSRIIVFITSALAVLGLAISFCTIGGLILTQESPKISYYANSTCEVYSAELETKTCRDRHYPKTLCYYLVWKVALGNNVTTLSTLEDHKQYSSRSTALRQLNTYKVGAAYQCWFDTRNPAVIQWNQPSDTAAILLLVFGGIFIFVVIFFSICSINLIQKEMRRSRYENMDF